MFWTFLPFILVVGVMWLSTKFNLGNFGSEESGYLSVPENKWIMFKSFLIVLMGIGLPAYLMGFIAKRKIKLGTPLYPIRGMKSWAHSLDEDMWTAIQIFAGTLIAMVVVTIIIFS